MIDFGSQDHATWECSNLLCFTRHDDVIKWKYFPRYWPFLRGIHRSPVNSPHKGQWSGALMFSLICPWINAWVDNCEAGGLRRHLVHYDVTTWSSNELQTLDSWAWYLHNAPNNGCRAKHPIASPWWRHQMETFSALLALCAGNLPVTGEFPSQRASDA